MGTKTIKDVDDRTWRKLRAFSAEYDMPMGRVLGKIIDEYELSSKGFWKSVFEGEKILTDKEAEDIFSLVRDIRKEKGFR